MSYFNGATFKTKSYATGTYTDILPADNSRRALHFYNQLSSTGAFIFELQHDTYSDSVSLDPGAHYEFVGVIPINAISVTAEPSTTGVVMFAGDADFAS